MTQDTEDVVIVRLLEALACDCDNTDGWEAAAPDVRKAAQLIQSLSDRIDGLKGIVEAAYREGWVGGEESGRADIIDGIGWSADFGWERSEARAALHQEDK